MKKVFAGVFLFLMLQAGCRQNNGSNSALSPFVSGLDNPYGMTQDAAGNLYVAERKLGSIVKITPAGVRSTYAEGSFKEPTGVAMDGMGNIYVADMGNGSVEKITPGGVRSAFGKGFRRPHDLKLDAAGNLYVVDDKYAGVFEITPKGVKTILAGNGNDGYRDGAAAQAEFKKPHGIAVDPRGVNVYVGDSANKCVRKISGGVVSTLADGFSNPQNLAVDGSGNVYVSDDGGGLKKITPAGVVSLVTSFPHSPRGVCLGPGGDLYVVDNGSPQGSNVVFKIKPPL